MAFKTAPLPDKSHCRKGPSSSSLTYPTQQRGRAVRQGVPDGLRLGALDLVIPGALPLEPAGALEPGAVGVGPGPERALRRQDRVPPERRRPRRQQVEVLRARVLRVQVAHGPGDGEAPVAALRRVPVVAQGQHELVHRLGVLGDREAALRDAAREAKIGQRRHHDVERRTSLFSPAQRPDELGPLEEAAGPAVHEDERDGARPGAALVDKVHVDAAEAVDGDGRRVLREPVVERRLGAAPVERPRPVGRQPLHVGEGHAEVPGGAVQLVREPRPRQAVLEICELRVGDGDAVGSDGCHF